MVSTFNLFNLNEDLQTPYFGFFIIVQQVDWFQ